MAGALTANSVTTAITAGNLSDAAECVATVAFLSPVEGANNVLLTAVFSITELDEESEITAQWWRCQIGATPADAVLGDAVGDPFVFMLSDSELIDAPIIVQAVDRGPRPASAYGLTLESAEEVGSIGDGFSVDAVLYD